LIKKKNIFFSAVNFFKFLVIKTPDWIRIGTVQPKMLGLDLDQMEADPQPSG
jgi:hypothetical protein